MERNTKQLLVIGLLGIVFLGLGILDNHSETISDDVFRILGMVTLVFIPYYLVVSRGK